MGNICIGGTFSVNTVEDGDTIQTVSVFKISNDAPAAPSGNTIPPSGWSTTPPRIYGWDFSAESSYQNYRQGKGQNVNNNFVVERVTFTAVSGTPVVIRIVASSETNFDFVYIGDLDTHQTARPSTKPSGRYVSGNGVYLDVSTAINSSGTHFLDIVYTKDSSTHSYLDSGFYKVISGADNIVYSNPRTVWVSTAKFVNDSLSGSWSTPVPYIENEKSVVVPKDGVTYELRPNISSIKIPSDTRSVTVDISTTLYKKDGEKDPVLCGAYIEAYVFLGSTYYFGESSSGSSSLSIEDVEADEGDADSFVFFAFKTSYEGEHPDTQPYLAKAEIPIIKSGNTGSRGKTGRAYYYAGTFVGDSTSHVVNDAQAPFFDYTTGGQKRYYVYAPDTNPSGGSITEQAMGTPNTSSNSSWKIMTSDFEYLITKAIFGEFAHFGSAIISGDWMISTLGFLYDGSGTEYQITGSNSVTIDGVTYNKDNAYRTFDPNYPNSSKNGSVNFVPAYCVDLMTGASYQQNAYIKGEVHATSGEFSGEIIARSGKIAGFDISGDALVASASDSSKTPRISAANTARGVGASVGPGSVDSYASNMNGASYFYAKSNWGGRANNVAIVAEARNGLYHNFALWGIGDISTQGFACGYGFKKIVLTVYSTFASGHTNIVVKSVTTNNLRMYLPSYESVLNMLNINNTSVLSNTNNVPFFCKLTIIMSPESDKSIYVAGANNNQTVYSDSDYIGPVFLNNGNSLSSEIELAATDVLEVMLIYDPTCTKSYTSGNYGQGSYAYYTAIVINKRN